MKKQVCPQCGYIIEQPPAVRCPRCNKLLLTACDGNCSQCRQKGKC